jgi:hypothetical protein
LPAKYPLMTQSRHPDYPSVRQRDATLLSFVVA